MCLQAGLGGRLRRCFPPELMIASIPETNVRPQHDWSRFSLQPKPLPCGENDPLVVAVVVIVGGGLCSPYVDLWPSWKSTIIRLVLSFFSFSLHIINAATASFHICCVSLSKRLGFKCLPPDPRTLLRSSCSSCSSSTPSAHNLRAKDIL